MKNEKIPHYKEIVVGCNLSSLIYSLYYDLPFVYSKREFPHIFETFHSDFDLKHLMKDVQNIEIKTFDNSLMTVGYSKLQLWNCLLFALSLRGLNLMHNEPVGMKVKNNVIKAMTSNGRKSEISFEIAHIFSDANLFNLPPPSTISFMNEDNRYKVYDIFDITSLLKNNNEINFDLYQGKDEFLNQIWFFIEQLGKRSSRKNLASVSFLSENQLEDYSFSDIEARFKALHIAENEWKLNIPEETRTKQILHLKREIIPLFKQNTYDSTDSLIFHEEKEEELIELYRKKTSYSLTFIQQLYNPRRKKKLNGKDIK